MAPDDSSHLRALLTVQNGRIVARGAGAGQLWNKPWTVDSLFAVIEESVREDGRWVDSLELHPRYGFPIKYDAKAVGWPDAWIVIRVDSFKALAPPRKNPH
jgi:hypothetical protein